MHLPVSGYLTARIEEISQEVKENNGEYAKALAKAKELLENIHPIIHSTKDISITAGDCLDFQEFLENEFTSSAIIHQELYKQGYLDCVKVLKMLGVLA